jgi:hypothetical protein
MDVLSAMLADAATAFNGKLYIHGGGWDSLLVQQFPALHTTMSLALLLCADAAEAPGTGELRVQLMDEDGNDTGVSAVGTIGIGHGPLHRPGQRSLVPIAVPFAGIRFDKPGTYEFRLSWNRQLLDPAVTFSVSTPTSSPGPTFPQQAGTR